MLCVSSDGKVFDATDRLARPIKGPRHLDDEKGVILDHLV